MDIQQDDVLIGVLSTTGIQGPPGPPGGVNSFNTRQGEVLPAIGDYDYLMTGSMPATEILTNSDIFAI
jgi:hypothetical protein